MPPADGLSSPRDVLRETEPALSLADRVKLICIAASTQDLNIKRHALLLLDLAAAPAFVVVRGPLEPGPQNDDLPLRRPFDGMP